MPVLRFFNDPPFVFVDEALDFIQQSLEVRFLAFFWHKYVTRLCFKGLAFLHRVGVAHR